MRYSQTSSRHSKDQSASACSLPTNLYRKSRPPPLYCQIQENRLPAFNFQSGAGFLNSGKCLLLLLFSFTLLSLFDFVNMSPVTFRGLHRVYIRLTSSCLVEVGASLSTSMTFQIDVKYGCHWTPAPLHHHTRATACCSLPRHIAAKIQNVATEGIIARTQRFHFQHFKCVPPPAPL